MKRISFVIVPLLLISMLTYGQSCGDSGKDRVIQGKDTTYAPGGKITLKGGASAVGGSIFLKPGDGMTDDGNVIMDLATNSRVGIGTTSPANKLHVNGTIQMTGFKLTTGATNGYVLTSNSSGVGTWQQVSGGGGTSWWDDNGDNIYCTNNGNVGIGTTSPSSRLSVGGNAGGGGEFIAIYGEGPETGGNSVGVYGKGSACYGFSFGVYGEGIDYGLYGRGTEYGSYGVYGIGNSVGVYGSGGTFDFYAPNSTKKSYFAGSVGIGTTTPQSELAVNGTITAEEIEVQVDVLPDFVFEDNYKLMPLNKLEKYIEKENSLPGIPKNKEVIKEGVKLGEMQAKLLEKVEELTLYVIELKKENEELKQRISLLEK